MRRYTKLKLAYVALAAADTALAGSRRPWAHRARFATKPLLLPLLGAAVVADPRATGSPLRSTTLAAQAGGWGGDVLLLGHGERMLAAGATSFGAGHLAYISGFLHHRERRTPLTASRAARVVAGLWATSGPVVAATAARQDRRLGGTLLGYSALLAAMAATATHLDPALPRDARLLTAAGGAMFLASDAVLGARSFLLPDAPQRLESVVMATYTGAQLLLAEGAVRAGR
ncbi:lysoplasmalogenase [Pimelobacter simplex]|uniref:lysoplasmalogenase n=1 Tax=Nocardioides simplex TaxID=2045 RepID=UPI001931E0D7|nr:lysoplasmalogenase [Pimelobacter simplex]